MASTLLSVSEGMALIKCAECGREISEQAQTCPGCGALTSVGLGQQPPPMLREVRYDPGPDTFTGSMLTMVKLAMRAVQELRWKLDQANEILGIVTFETGVRAGSREPESPILGFRRAPEM